MVRYHTHVLVAIVGQEGEGEDGERSTFHLLCPHPQKENVPATRLLLMETYRAQGGVAT